MQSCQHLPQRVREFVVSVKRFYMTRGKNLLAWLIPILITIYLSHLYYQKSAEDLQRIMNGLAPQKGKITNDSTNSTTETIRETTEQAGKKAGTAPRNDSTKSITETVKGTTEQAGKEIRPVTKNGERKPGRKLNKPPKY